MVNNTLCRSISSIFVKGKMYYQRVIYWCAPTCRLYIYTLYQIVSAQRKKEMSIKDHCVYLLFYLSLRIPCGSQSQKYSYRLTILFSAYTYTQTFYN